jgi:hypothetical protein
METALSVNGIPIRLTGERWMHITSGHPEMASFFFEVLETIEQPIAVFEGTFEEKIAVGIIRDYPPKHIVVVYRETGTDDVSLLLPTFQTENSLSPTEKSYGNGSPNRCSSNDAFSAQAREHVVIL